MFKKMTKSTARLIEFAILLGVLILVNILVSDAHGRWDLTADKQYTLSQTSRDVVGNLKDELRVTLYSSPDLPTVNEAEMKSAVDLIDEYKTNANSNFVFAEEHPSIDDKEEVKRLQAIGIQPRQMGGGVGGQNKVEIGAGYLDLVITYGSKEPEVIPNLGDPSSLEYAITHAIFKLTTENIPAVGVYAGTGKRPMTEEGGYNGLGQVLKSQYPAKDVDLSKGTPVPEDVGTMIILNPETFGTKEKLALDQFIMRGGKVIFFVSPVDTNLQQGWRAKRAPTPWADFLTHYNVKVDSKLVGDLQSSAGLRTQNSPFPIWYPFWPKITAKYFGDLAFTANLESLVLPWASPVTVDETQLGEDVQATYLFSSTEKSYSMAEPFNLDPGQFGRDFAPQGEITQYHLGVMLKGVFNSYFAGKGVPTEVNDQGVAQNLWEGELTQTSVPTEIVVIGCLNAVSDLGMSQPNAIFLMNMIDSLNLGKGLIELRSRTVTDRPIKADLTERDKAVTKFMGIFLIPLLFSFFGIGRYMLRNQTRKMVEAKTLGMD